VFPLYLVHQTVLIVAAVALRPLALPAGVEAAVIVVLTFGGGCAAWQLARRIGWLRPWMGLTPRSSAPALQRAMATGT
jgi:glucan biosynthesis protein C